MLQQRSHAGDVQKKYIEHCVLGIMDMYLARAAASTSRAALLAGSLSAGLQVQR